MNRFILSTAFLSVFTLLSVGTNAQTRVLVHLSDVNTIYVDDNAFKIVWSPCTQTVGTLRLSCAKDIAKRVDFLAALKRWLGKSGFTVVDNKDGAEAILDGTLGIYDQDYSLRDTFPRPGRRHRDKDGDKGKDKDAHRYPHIDHQRSYQLRWEVKAWLVNQKDRRIWNLGPVYPDISYAGKQPKIEGKRLAKSLLYDFKHYH
ncbi:MAG: hypothetical protein ABI878_14755 [Acidobacteriota bacterium]